MSKRSYLWAAFVARPLGMPVPPNLFALAGFALLGAFVSGGFWLLGAGLELAYLMTLSSSPRFRRAVDAEVGAVADDPVDRRYQAVLDKLGATQRERHAQIESRAREIFTTLGDSPLMATHADSLEQLVWLNLRLLLARQAIAAVVTGAHAERARLDQQEAQIVQRLAEEAIDPDLRRSLEQQRTVIDQRQAAHADAIRRQEHVDAELDRIDQQIALIREQALLATNEENVGASLDALAVSFNEANRWLRDQRDLLGSLDFNDHQRLPQSVLRGNRTIHAQHSES